MWTRQDILKGVADAKLRYLEHNQSARICEEIVIDTAIRMALDNAAAVAEQHGDPQIEDAIHDLQDQFTLGT